MIDGQRVSYMTFDEPHRLQTGDGVAETTPGVAQVFRGDPVQVPRPGQTPAAPPVRRGTTNGTQRGSSTDRRRRREWLVTTWRADVDVLVVTLFHGPVFVPVPIGTPDAVPACRCYRCGRLLTVDTVSADRVVPGCRGGTYRRENIRPACERCNSVTGGSVRGARPKATPYRGDLDMSPEQGKL